ncbi:ABC transporter permease [Sunxiuqinia elliptica]|uniref:Putative ABC transport system permease protein n=1 Tax=Sunxiuqinia elliptica TaxID=655355 RepID=A0A1I2AGJ2_9BACT|nr:ABC transporter permease [Sunxiuqinia elliptica]SFE43091.1 putative ABC transport system permease protein [Sunxiuqinia elliptica]
MTISNNLKTAFRHFGSDKTNTFINLTGLTLGLGIVAVVLVFVLNELSYNQSFANRNQIFRVINYNEDDDNQWANTPFVLGSTAFEQFAEVEAFVHQYTVHHLEVKAEEEYLPENSLLCTEAAFFNMFGVELIHGELSGFDHSKNKLVISQEAASKYFGTQNPVGEMLTVRKDGAERNMEVVAVFEDFAPNSTIKASLVASPEFGLENLKQTLISTGEVPEIQEMRESWENGLFFTTYLLLNKAVDPTSVEAKLRELGEQYSSEDNQLNFSLQALTNIYFESGQIVDNNAGDKGNRSMLLTLVGIGILILAVACVNYLNLSSAQALMQTKALAVRKVCGASRGKLVGQLVTESVLMVLIALPFSLLACQLSLPLISQMLGKSYVLVITDQLLLSLSILLLVAVGTGVLSGVLVALKITSFRLTETLKGKYANANNKHRVRKAMVVFQLSVFMVLIAVMFLSKKQVHYAFNKDLGIEKEGLVRIPLGDHNYALFKEEILKSPSVVKVSGALWIPPHKGKMFLSIPKVDEPNQLVKVNGLFVDYGFAETMGMQLILGNDFDKEKNATGVLVNEQAIETLGLTEIIGEQTAFGPVVGVVKDFNMYSVREAVTPMLIGINPQMCREIAVRIKTKNISKTIAFLEDAWKTTGGTTAFDFDFTDDILNQIYEAEIRFSKIIGLLAGVAILIGSLGLFGLSLLISRQRTKEIGIRKVNGAKVGEILTMLNKDFVRWVMVAFLISTPIAYYAMTKWLENFAYKTSLSWWIFALAGLLALGIALLTVSWQSWRAATRNPVEALRYE